MVTTRLLAATLLGLMMCAIGCVQRTVKITSNPSGALVHLNDQEVGRTPVTVPFTFYGKYDVRLEREGFQTLSTTHDMQAPWWEFPGPDLVAEAIPNARSQQHWHFDLSPQAPVNELRLQDRAQQMRALTQRGDQR